MTLGGTPFGQALFCCLDGHSLDYCDIALRRGIEVCRSIDGSCIEVVKGRAKGRLIENELLIIARITTADFLRNSACPLPTAVVHLSDDGVIPARERAVLDDDLCRCLDRSQGSYCDKNDKDFVNIHIGPKWARLYTQETGCRP